MESIPNPNPNPNPNLKKEEEARNWLELPADIISMILLKLGVVEILNRAQKVCSLWRNICKDPFMWRIIDIPYLKCLGIELGNMCLHVVDRSCGRLVDISIECFATDELLQYITKSSNQLKRLRLDFCYGMTDLGLIKAVSELPSLECLEIYLTYFTAETLGAVGRCCPLLKSFKLLNIECYRNTRPLFESDEEAFAIAENMTNLHHLQICDNGLTDKGLQAILEGCPKLESLDLRRCFHLNMKGDLASKCAQIIQNLRLPQDSVDDYEFKDFFDDDDFYEDYMEVGYMDP